MFQKFVKKCLFSFLEEFCIVPRFRLSCTFVYNFKGVEAEELLDYKGRAGILSIVWWNLRPVLCSVEKSKPYPYPSGDLQEASTTKEQPKTPRECSEQAGTFLCNMKRFARAHIKRAHANGVVLLKRRTTAFWCLLESPFLEPLLRTPSKNPSQNPSSH